MVTRREKLESLLREMPGDPFLRYGLAVEFASEGDSEKALEEFRALMIERPPYIAAFFRAGQLLVEEGRIDEARTMLREGIDAARAAGESHAAAEMSELLVQLADFAE